MIEQLFGSRTRFKLLKHFYKNPNESFFVRQLVRVLSEQLNSIRRELANLESLGVVVQNDGNTIDNLNTATLPRHKYYRLNDRFVLHKELEGLVLKSNLLFEKNLRENIDRLGNIKFLALTGNFVANPNFDIDMLIVGNLKKEKVNGFINQLVKSFDQDVRYTILTPQEYQYRKNVADRFLLSILEDSRNIIMIDRL